MTHTNKSEIKMSVIIATRNRDMVISECLNRLLDDHEKPFEIIVIDSSSNDTTKNILKAYPSVQYYRIGDIAFSLVYSYNLGISKASGEIVAFIDDDCFIQPGWYSNLSSVFVDQDIIAAGGRIIYHPWNPQEFSQSIAVINLDKDNIWAKWNRISNGNIDVPILPGGNCAVRRDVAIEVGGFDTNFVGSANLFETDFFFRVSQTGKRIIFLPDAVVEHRAAPRTDKTRRSQTNFIYRYSAVRNRIYLHRKYKSKGLLKALKSLFSQLAVESIRIIFGAISFALATTLGIFIGLFTKKAGKNESVFND
jgi:glycosyltransferase involved in cell wall biosynthesis